MFIILNTDFYLYNFFKLYTRYLMIIGSIIKNAIKILATNPTARKKAGEVVFKTYKKAKPIIKKTSESLKETLHKNLTK